MKNLNFALCLVSATLGFSTLAAEEVSCSVTGGLEKVTTQILNPKGNDKESTMTVKVEGAFRLDVNLRRRNFDEKYVLTAALVSEATEKSVGKTALMKTLGDTLPINGTVGYMENDLQGEEVGDDTNLLTVVCSKP